MGKRGEKEREIDMQVDFVGLTGVAKHRDVVLNPKPPHLKLYNPKL